MSLTKKSSYHFDLPDELIAQYPVKKRSDSRLLYLNKESGDVKHNYFEDIVDILKPDDILVVNNTKVIPARLHGNKTTGAAVEVFLLRQTENVFTWECLVKPGRKIKLNTVIEFDKGIKGNVIKRLEGGKRIIRFSGMKDFWGTIKKIGKIPLPPYIKREAEEKDKKTYQTVYAKKKGSVAAPTAGLHFTDKILHQLKEKGIEILEVLLHVGLGTFRPVQTDDIKNHKMHSEYCSVSKDTAQKINTAKANGQRIIAVGTTTTRTLESFVKDGKLDYGSHWTDIFIYPGKQFHIINGLITNFHLPESTLLMLVAAFAGYENTLAAYRQAVENRYRFFSYGDSMLIL